MPRFQFQARTEQGQPVNGEMEATTLDSVAAQLISRGITPIKIQEASFGSSYIKKINRLLGAERVRSVDLIMFCRQMHTVGKSGVTLTRGLRGLAASIRHDFFRDTVNDVAEKLETGMSLSRAMSQHPKVFNSLFISMINVGENSGKLDEVFEQIGFYIDRDEQTKKRVKSALRYPSFVVIALIIAIVAINIWVVPAFANLFAKFNAELPLVTQILIGTSNLFVNYWLYILIISISTLIAWIYYLSTDEGAYNWGQYKLKLPIVGGIVERASMARYARSFSLMLSAGVPITQALNLCSAAIDNAYLERKILDIREGIARGESLLRTHYQAEMFTPLVLQMVSVGEESGRVEELLQEVADFYDREVDYDLKTLTDRIEPILIITMAVFVTILALGIFLPMWSIYEIQS